MFSHVEQIDRTNVVQFTNYLNEHFFHASYRWDKLTKNTQVSGYLYASTDCDYVTDSGVYYDADKRTVCNAFNGDTLTGKVYSLVMGKGNIIGIVIFEHNMLYFIMLDSPYHSDMKLADSACRKLSARYKTPLMRINLNLAARCLIHAYGTDFTSNPYLYFPPDSISDTSNNHEIIVKKTHTRKWDKEATPAYTVPMFQRLTELNRIMRNNGHVFEIRVN